MSRKEKVKLQNKETLERSKSTNTAGNFKPVSFNKNIKGGTQYESYSPDVVRKAKSGKVSNLTPSNQTINTRLIRSKRKKSERNLAQMKQGERNQHFKANHKFREQSNGCKWKTV